MRCAVQTAVFRIRWSSDSARSASRSRSTPSSSKSAALSRSDTSRGCALWRRCRRKPWPFGGSPGLPPRSWQQYLAEVPLLEHKSRQSWRQKIGDLRATLKTLGREDFFLANNEYGLGKGSAFAG